MRRLPLPALVGLLLCVNAHADNGQLASAYPASDITIDGDLSDWPEDLVHYPVMHDNQGEVRTPSDDFDAAWRGAYDPAGKQLFVALEVRDDIHFIDEDPEAGWQAHDGVILYLDPNHTTTGSGSALFWAGGALRDMLTPDYTWDVRTLELDWEDAELAIVRKGDTTTYEWRLAVPRDLGNPLSLGFDLLVIDHDGPDAEGGGQLTTWSPGLGKSQGGGRLGDLLLVQPDVPSGRLEGTVTATEAAQPDEENAGPPFRVRMVSEDHPELWVQTQVDDNGAYGIDLPAGRWTVSLPDHARGQAWNDSFVAFAPGKPVDTIITAGETTELPALSLDATPRPVTTLGEPGRLFRWSAENEPEFERLVAELMTYYEVPGASIALVKDGALVYHNVFGTQNAYTGEPVKPETLFEAASITKIVFAFVVNRMAERGEIDLDKPLYEYLPFEELAYDERYRKITARHALSHQTGMPNWRWQNDDGEIDLKFYPGIQFGYSGEGYEYLGRVVAHLMGKPLAQVLMEEVQQPMGFTEKTFFSDSDELRAVASRGHYSGLATPHSFAGEPGMAFSMVTEASVFSNFMISLMARKGLSAEGYTAMFEPQIAVPPDDEDDEGEWPSRYGLGFHMMNSPVGLVWGHGGNNGDFVCMFEAYDAQNAGFIIFTNANSGIGLVDGLREYLVVGEEPDEAVARVD